MTTLGEQFGSIDIYLFDQLLRGRVRADRAVLDAGCGHGRNLIFLMRSGHDVSGVDADPACIAAVRSLAARLAPGLDASHFPVARVEALPFRDGGFGTVISSAVLHFAADEIAFDRMLDEMWRVLAPGGMLFARLASTIGIEDRVVPVEGRRCRLPDGSVRFLVDEPMLLERVRRLGASLLDPIKTTNVQNQRCMTTWVLRRDG